MPIRFPESLLVTNIEHGIPCIFAGSEMCPKSIIIPRVLQLGDCRLSTTIAVRLVLEAWGLSCALVHKYLLRSMVLQAHIVVRLFMKELNACVLDANKQSCRSFPKSGC